MHTLGQNILLRLLKAINCILMTMVFAGGYLLFYREGIQQDGGHQRLLVLLLLFAIFYYAFGKVYDAFLISLAKVSEIIYAQVLTLLVVDCLMYVILCLILNMIMNVRPFFCILLFQILVSVLWSYFTNKWYYSFFPPRRSAIVYDLREGFEKLIDSYGMTRKFDIKWIGTTDQCLQNMDVLKDMDTIFLSGVHSKERNQILKYCMYNYKEVYVIPRVGDVLMSSAKKIHMFHLPIMKVTAYNPSPFYLFVKRVFYIVVSATALIILSPVFIITMIAIKAADGGPVFYKQERLTKGGKKFWIHKFRSMCVDAEKDGKARLSTGDKDDRITPVGHVIRKFRIDELPQLIDIIHGDLSIVGPRPEREEIALEYEKEIPEFHLRLQAKAGLTGYAQVYGKYNSTPYDKLQMDLMYIANPSFIEDLKICLATVKILFIPESTEGIEDGAVNALGVKKENS